MGALLQDLRYAGRALSRQPAFAAVVVATLALGIAATTMVFGVVHGVLVRPLHYPDSSRLVVVLSEFRDGGVTSRVPAAFPGDFVEWSAQARGFERMSAAAGGVVNLAGAGEPERLQSASVTGGFFETLGVRPVAGRTFGPDEVHGPGAPVAVLSTRVWQRKFGGDPAVVGRTILLDRRAVTVVGVVPAELAYPPEVEVWTPLVPAPGDRRNAFLQVVGRLAARVSLAQAQAEMSTIAARLEATTGGRHVGVAVVPLQQFLVGDVRRPLLVFSGAVGLLLLIACADVASMLLARGEARREEVAVRTALGASRLQLARPFLCESLLLALAGGGCGALLAGWGMPVVVALVPAGTVPRLQETSVDAAVLAFAAVVSLLVSVGVGLFPAARAGRGGRVVALRGPSARGGVPGFSALRALVAAEVALSVALLAGSTLLLRSFVRLASVDPGFVPAHVLTLNVSLPDPGGCAPPACLSAGPEAPVAFHQAVLERLRRLPGVESAGAVNWLPLGGNLLGGDFAVEGRSAWPAGLMAAKTSVSPQYFRAMGIRLLRGRAFDDKDARAAAGVAIVSESLARRLWPGQAALGRRVKVGIGGDPDHEPWRTVVGVVADVTQETLASEPAPTLYSPLAQAPLAFLVSDVTYVLRTAGEPSALAAAATREIHHLDPALPVTRVQPLASLVSASLAPSRLRSALLATFAGLGLALAGMGIFGVLGYSVSRRGREIGLRMALGAAPGEVVSLVVRQALAMTLLGLGLGLCVAVLLTRALGGFLYQVSPGDPLAYTAAAAALLAVALLATWAPARRATRVDPVAALRSE